MWIFLYTNVSSAFDSCRWEMDGTFSIYIFCSVLHCALLHFVVACGKNIFYIFFMGETKSKTAISRKIMKRQLCALNLRKCKGESCVETIANKEEDWMDRVQMCIVFCDSNKTLFFSSRFCFWMRMRVPYHFHFISSLQSNRRWNFVNEPWWEFDRFHLRWHVCVEVFLIVIVVIIINIINVMGCRATFL